MSDSCLPIRLLLRLVLDGERGHPPAALLEQVQAVLPPVHHRHCNLICVPGQAFQQRQGVFLAPAKLVFYGHIAQALRLIVSQSHSLTTIAIKMMELYQT